MEPDGECGPAGRGDTRRGPAAGSAESIPLPDGSVDAVVAGQAYHWFDPEARARRRSPACCGRQRARSRPVWHVPGRRRPRSGTCATVGAGAVDDRLAHLNDHERHEQRVDEAATAAPRFGPVEPAGILPSGRPHPAQLVELIKTRSYFLTAPPCPRRR